MGCGRPVKSRGLCATHYQRQRRTGDPNKTRTAGRKPNHANARVAAILKDTMSPRSLARHQRAMRIFGYLSAAGFGCDWAEVRKLSTRPNGTLNVARLERIAEAQLIITLAENDGFPDRDWLATEFGIDVGLES